MRNGLTHIDQKTGDFHMVDIGNKPVTQREARAMGRIRMNAAAFDTVRTGMSKKGDVLSIAQIAGIQATKKTSDLIPLCHPLALSKVSVTCQIGEASNEVFVESIARTTGRTGVEMEALTAVSIACLTIYDMLKSVDKSMEIISISLLEKKGGKSGDFKADD